MSLLIILSFLFNEGATYKSLAYSSTGMRLEHRAPHTAWVLKLSCSISLLDGVSFRPSLTMLTSLSVTHDYLALQYRIV